MIELHYVATANGLKVAIMLLECGLEYRVINYDLFGGDLHLYFLCPTQLRNHLCQRH